MKTSTNIHAVISPLKRIRQRGTVLFIALIALVALSLAGIAIIRSVDTANMISGNMAFREAALQNSDVGIETAFNSLPTILATSKNANIANRYFALHQAEDSNGIPTTVTWDNVPCRDKNGDSVTCSAQDYQVKYVIERMCEQQTAGSTIVSNYQGYCFVDIGAGKSGSKGVFSTVFSSADAVYYRATVQVTGPKNTKVYVQALFSKG